MRVPRLDMLAPGSLLDGHEVLGRLAVGGMAEIYLARVSSSSELVAVKTILPDFASNEEYVGMFLDEARLAALLHHPNLIEVRNIGISDGRHFYSMEYVPGQNLQRLLVACRRAGREVPFEHAVSVGVGIAAALHHAHEAQRDGHPLRIVHRDVSPSNILCSYDGGVKLLDFGVAKAADRQSSTRAGTLKGKVAYMSPEQCRGDEVDRRSDVFALGIVLYELTTRVRPFQGDGELGVVRSVLETTPRAPSELRPGYPPRLERIVMRALSSDPQARQPTALDLQRELEAFARDEGLPLSAAGLGAFLEEMVGEERDAGAEPDSYVWISIRGRTERKSVLTRQGRARRARSMLPQLVEGLMMAVGFGLVAPHAYAVEDREMLLPIGAAPAVAAAPPPMPAAIAIPSEPPPVVEIQIARPARLRKHAREHARRPVTAVAERPAPAVAPAPAPRRFGHFWGAN